MSIVLDCTQSPSVSAMKSVGAVAVCRYLSWLYRWGGTSHNYINPKIIQKNEFDRLTEGGEPVLLNWEYDPKDWLGGSEAGKAHSIEAVRQAKLLGAPQNQSVGIVGSADFDMSLSQWNSGGKQYMTEYSARVRGEGYLSGPYGPYDVLTWVHDAGLGDIFWQAGMSWAWSNNRNKTVHPQAHLFQQKHMNVGGIDCDVNVVLKSPFGTWPALGNVAPGQPNRAPDLLLDGILGRNTISRAQNILGTPVDGVIDQPPLKSSLVKAMQHRMNVAINAGLTEDGQGINQDGHSVFKTTKALQRYLGMPVQDGMLSRPTSECVKALQVRLNTGKF